MNNMLTVLLKVKNRNGRGKILGFICTLEESTHVIFVRQEQIQNYNYTNAKVTSQGGMLANVDTVMHIPYIYNVSEKVLEVLDFSSYQTFDNLYNALKVTDTALAIKLAEDRYWGHKVSELYKYTIDKELYNEIIHRLDNICKHTRGKLTYSLLKTAIAQIENERPDLVDIIINGR